jgi:hypothetical protein
MPETCWVVFERRAINLRDWWIWLVDLFEYMMMHGLTNPKFIYFSPVSCGTTIFHADNRTCVFSFTLYIYVQYINVNTGPHTVHVLANLESGRTRLVKFRCPNWSVTSSQPTRTWYGNQSDTTSQTSQLIGLCLILHAARSAGLVILSGLAFGVKDGTRIT